MRKPVFFITLNTAILLLVFGFLMQSLVIIHMLGTVDHLQGRVEIKRRGGEWKAAYVNDVVHASDMVRTASDSTAELRWRDGTRLRLAPRTILTIRRYAQNALSRGQLSLFDLTVGKVWVRISRALKPQSQFEIKTANATTAALGTVFSVAVEGNRTNISVFEGKVKVHGPREEVVLESGRDAAISQSGAETFATPEGQTREWGEQERIVRPGLIVEEPAPQLTAVTASLLRVKGYVEPDSTLTINGEQVRHLGGTFSKKVALRAGRNTITLVATDRHGRQTMYTRTITLSANGNS